MGLAVSQVRLLALTNRKADIELRMQVDSKRKMMLTRKSTELAQQYYAKLKCANIQYATSSGYEDVNFNYLMGETEGNSYSKEFIQGIATGSSKVVKKAENNMVLIDEMGRVIVNDQMAVIIEKARDTYNGLKNSQRVCSAILDLVEQHKGDVLNTGDSLTTATAASFLHRTYTDEFGQIDVAKKNALRDNMTLMLKNGGYKDGGVIYIHGTGTDKPAGRIAAYESAEIAQLPDEDRKDKQMVLQKGYMYQVRNENGYLCSSEAFYGSEGFSTDMSVKTAQYLSNLISYFAPIISAGLQNGITTTVAKTPANTASEEKYNYLMANNVQMEDNLTDEEIMQKLGLVNVETGGTLTFNESAAYNGQIFKIDDADGLSYYYKAVSYTVRKVVDGNPVDVKQWKIYPASASDYYEYTADSEVDSRANNSIYRAVKDVDTLQNRFKSGLCQLAMVTDTSKGTYHKNTTMNYFTHMNYVVERADSSRKEEITAWFNKEQAAVSEQETYWDTEIQNLSTELSSVNTEIQSVKQLKSDSIKSVFNWGEG